MKKFSKELLAEVVNSTSLKEKYELVMSEEEVHLDEFSIPETTNDYGQQARIDMNDKYVYIPVKSGITVPTFNESDTLILRKYRAVDDITSSTGKTVIRKGECKYFIVGVA